MFYRFQLHLERKGSFAGQNVFALQVGIHHQDNGSIIVKLTDDNRRGFHPSQLSGVASAGYNLIFTIRHGTGNKRKQNTVFADALHRVHHGFIVDHLERMIFEWHELIQRYLADFLQTRILTAGFRREQIDAGFQAYAAGIKCHARSPPAPASRKRAQLCLSHYAHRCCIQGH